MSGRLFTILTIVMGFSFHAKAMEPGECMKIMSGVSSEQSEFRSTVLEFLDSVKSRDFETFKKYLNEELEFKAILPGGKVFDSVRTFVASQADWFNGTTGRFEFSLERVEVSSDLGTAFAKAEYENLDANGKPFKLEIEFTFRFQRIGTQWFLIYDENRVLRDMR